MDYKVKHLKFDKFGRIVVSAEKTAWPNCLSSRSFCLSY